MCNALDERVHAAVDKWWRYFSEQDEMEHDMAGRPRLSRALYITFVIKAAKALDPDYFVRAPPPRPRMHGARRCCRLPRRDGVG